MAPGERVEGTHVSNRMNLEEVSDNIALTKQPSLELSPCLQARWWAKKGDWEEAHSIAQEVHDSEGYWVHAYLHRVEGDLGNAEYWYARAGKPVKAREDLNEEWDQMARVLLSSDGK